MREPTTPNMRFIAHCPCALLAGLALGPALAFCSQAADSQMKPIHYRTAWVGNSFGGGPKWVQNFNDQMQVLPDGTVYLASFWDEGGREVGIYKNGDVIGKLEHTHMRGGFAVAVGGGYAWYAHTCAREDQPPVKAGEARSDKPICYFGVSRNSLDGKPAPFDGGKTSDGNMLVLREALDDHALIPQGLAANDQLLVVADTARDRVLVLDVATLKQVREFEIKKPMRVALAPDGAIWVLSGGHFEVQDFDPQAAPAKIFRVAEGRDPVEIEFPLPAHAQPSSLAFDNQRRLLMADQGPNAQVLVFDVMAHPRLVEAFGEKGGLYSGPHPGRTGPLRFAGLTGAATDAAGNLYVGCNVPRGGTVLRAFSPSKKMLWELLNLEIVDVGDADPASDGRLIYTADGKYSFDPSAPPGKGWQWVAQTLDPFRYPDDLRIHFPGLQCGTELRRLDGHLFICLRGMWQGILGLYRVDGDMAMPSVVLTSGPLKAENGNWKASGQPEKGRFFWRDVNGNGQMDPGEYTATEGPTGEYWASDVDAKGDIWQGGRDTGIWRWRFEGLDAHGTPRYNPAPVHYPMPAPITDLLRVEYQPESDSMFLTGQTKEHAITGGEWGTVGTEVICYDHWSTNPVPRYRTVLPYEKGSIWGESFAVAGDLFFIVIGKTAEVYVYAQSDGRLLGTMKPGPEVHGESGWTDIRDAIRAFRRQNGDYLVFVEEDAKGKCMVYEMTDPLSGAAPQTKPVTTRP